MSRIQTKPLRVIYVLGSISRAGGVERVLTDKMNYLVSVGCEITLVTYEQGTNSIYYPLNPLVRHIDTGTRFFRLYNYPYPKRFYESIKLRRIYRQKLQKIVDDIQPNVISTVTYDLEICDIIPKLKTSAKLIIESHCAKAFTKDYTDGRRGLKMFLTRIRQSLQFHKIAKYDVLVTLTQGDADAWRSIAKRVVIIPNPITFYPDVINVSRGNRRIIAAGHLHNSKGFDMLIDAFSLIQKKCPQWQVCIYGDGEDLDNLKQLIFERKMQDHIFIYPATQDIYEEYQKSDFLVLSSRYEGFGLVLLEAMSCGIPCVAFNCQYGPRYIIENGYNGILVENGNIEELAHEILWMCNNPEECEKMGIAARKSSYQYKKELIMPKWLELFTE